MNRQASLLAQLHHDGHGIVLEVTRVGAYGVLAGGIHVGGIDAVGVGTELEHHGIEAIGHNVIQHLHHTVAEIRLGALGGAVGIDGLHIELGDPDGFPVGVNGLGMIRDEGNGTVGHLLGLGLGGSLGGGFGGHRLGHGLSLLFCGGLGGRVGGGGSNLADRDLGGGLLASRGVAGSERDRQSQAKQGGKTRKLQVMLHDDLLA